MQLTRSSRRESDPSAALDPKGSQALASREIGSWALASPIMYVACHMVVQEEKSYNSDNSQSG